MPTANGIKLSGDSVFVSNTLHQQVLRIEIESDGRAGNVDVWDKGIAGDDFDIDGNGRLYLTTHPFNTVVRLEQESACAIVGDVSIGIAGPTAATFGARAQDRSILYVLSDGGYSRPVEDGQPSIIGLDLEHEPPRLSRRLHSLRGWSNDKKNEIFPGSPGTGGTSGL